uniref:ATP-binding cassette sub-family G member n=1 Tax=Daphnia magna TaxID=35525 RepID=A0A0P5XID2_9CRUS
MAESWEMTGRERRYSVPAIAQLQSGAPAAYGDSNPRTTNTAEDLHAWSIYRQNLNSDFADSALGSNMKAPLPYGNFQLDSTTINSIMNHPKCGPKSNLAHNTNAYLKFGLPRVVARSGREESSGYDSSNDGSPVMRSKNLLLSRSDPDFRKNLIQNPNGAIDGQQGHKSRSREQRMKSISEANLLSAEGFRQRPDPTTPHLSGGGGFNSRPVSQQSKYSKTGAGGGASSHLSFQLRQQQRSRHIQGLPGGGGIVGSVTGAGFSVYPQRDEIMLNEKYFPRDEYFAQHQQQFNDGNNDGDELMAHQQPHIKHPHLQVRGLSYDRPTVNRNRIHLLDDISFEARAGEILGILATSEREGTALLDILANLPRQWGFKVRGDLVVNGVTMTSAGLSDRLAYVQQDIRWCPDMTVRQTLLFTALLQAPGRPARNFDTKGRIDALITDLGLEPVRNTRVGRLTVSERRRLNVASHLLLDTDIVLLDQPTKGMDIFDTFFLVEYLRQWAARGRIVLLTVHPPTYEIFTMLSRVALISSGRMMYCGRRREMLPYFAFIEFPCPAYKNPSDYYLDLVTLDDLTGEALLESSQRAEHLAETFRRRQEPLSDPGPPGILPPRNKRANFLLKIAALWIRSLVFTFPTNLRRWFAVLTTSVVMSLIHGAIFWNVRSTHHGLLAEQEDINDRLALHYVLGTVAIWPTLMLMITDVWKERDSLERDVKDRLFGRWVHFASKTTSSFLAAGGIFMGYLLPAYALAGFNTAEGLFIEIGYMMFYLYAIRIMTLSLASLCSSRHVATVASAVLVTLTALGSGFAVQLQTMNWWTSWLRWVSPLRWTLHSLQRLDFGNATQSFECSRNPLTRQEAPGLVLKIPCGLSSGSQALSYWAHQFDWLPLGPLLLPLLAVLAFWALFALIESIVLLFSKPVGRKLSRHKNMKFR